MKPDFCILGAPKCGTSELYNRMVKHPGIEKRTPKELHFYDTVGIGNKDRVHLFTKHGIHPDSNLAAYEARFDSPLLSGDATPSYLANLVTPIVMREDCPDCKMIVTLRDPTARLVSHIRVSGERDETKHTYLSNSKPFHQLFQWGLYADQLRRWYLHFPKDQILVLFNEEIALSPNETLERVYRFLGLPDHDRKYTPFVATTSPTADGRFTSEDLVKFRRWYSRYNEDLAELLDSPIPLTWNSK